jgi:hypothetical protein
VDPQISQFILNFLLGGGGLVGAVTVVRTWRRRKDELPSDETEARRAADWETLNAYFQGELKTLRKDRDRMEREFKDEINALRASQVALRDHFQAQSEADEEHIDSLTEHIWMRLPPPPPARKRPSAPPSIPGT